MDDTPFIIEATAENFAQIMEASVEVPVLMDFWASWCQPCRVLMPILARLAAEYQGKFLLAKLNTEEQPEVASHFGIRSIPTVKLFRDGRPVDEFMGALPERAVREFLDRYVTREPDPQLARAQEHLLAGDVDAAAAILDSLTADQQASHEVAALRNRLFFASQAAGAPATADLEARLAANAADHEALHQLALRRVLEQDYDAAVELLLQLMRTDRGFGDDAGRRSLLKVFELLGDDPRVGSYRRRMASLLH